MNSHLLDSFNTWVGYALGDLADLPRLDAGTYPISRRLRIEGAMTSLCHASGRASSMKCTARKALCMRLMNWLRAELRALPAKDDARC